MPSSITARASPVFLYPGFANVFPNLAHLQFHFSYTLFSLTWRQEMRELKNLCIFYEIFKTKIMKNSVPKSLFLPSLSLTFFIVLRLTVPSHGAPKATN
jgi:hypothetical protein